MNETIKVVDGQVVKMEYTLKVDGQVVDTSEGGQQLEFIQGTGNIIPGLERALYNMAVGDSKDVIVAVQDGYGNVDNEAFMDVPREQFPANVPMENGVMLELQDQNGHPVFARVDEVGETTVRLDFNHPLAGKELHFAVTIAGLRPATDEELEHGHIHNE